jgi:predicted dehydrogenase
MTVQSNPRIRFALIGAEHDHGIGMVARLCAAGAELVACHAAPHQLASLSQRVGRSVPGARSADEVLDDPGLDLIVTAAKPADRARIGLEAMARGKDVLAAKPGFTSLDQIAAIEAAHASTGRRYLIWFCERLDSPSTLLAQDILAAGEIGTFLHMVGLAPHRVGTGRPAWFWDSAQTGGILNDLACHQIDQFLAFSGTTTAEISSSAVSCTAEGFQYLGEVNLRSGGASGYARVDWLSAAGLPVWGDVRLFLVGELGSIEVRKMIDPCGRPGPDQLIVANEHALRRIDASRSAIDFAARLLRDVGERTESAIRQDHCLEVSRLALLAQAAAELRVGAAHVGSSR